MSANSLSLQPPLAAGFARVGFGSLPLERLEARYGNATQGSHYIEIDGFNVHYRDEGSRDKPALILIHGVVASLHTWDGWVQAFAPDYRIIRFDVPGFGLTGPARDAVYSVERMIRVLGQLLDYLQVDKADIVGNSLGGYIAWNFALAQPQRVGKLVLIDPTGYPMHTVPWMIATAALPGATVAMPMWMPRALIAQGIKEVYGELGRIKPGVVDRYYDLSRRPGNRRGMMDIFRVLLRVNKEELHTTPERVAQIKVPTLLMWVNVIAGFRPSTCRCGSVIFREFRSRSTRASGTFPWRKFPSRAQPMQ